MEPDRRWLKVPYKERQQAKAKGAQWDALVKMWWVPMHVPRKSVQKWLLKPIKPQVGTAR